MRCLCKLRQTSLRSHGRQMLKTAAMFVIALVVVCGRQHFVNAQPPVQHYIPADELETVFERSHAGVLLPRADFQKLLQQARDAKQQLNQHPSASVISAARYQVSLSDKHAVIQLDVDIQQYADSWVAIPLVVGNMAVEAATIGETSAVLGRTDNASDTLTLMHRNPGRFTLTLKMSTPLGSVGSDSVAAFRLLPDVASAMTVKVPSGQHLEWNGFQLDRPAPDNEVADYRLPAGNHDTVRLKWTSQQQQADTDSLVFARSDVVLQLSPDSLRWTSETRLSVFGKSINQVIAKVPAKLEITAVDSTGLESWTLEDDPDQAGITSVVLNYRQPFTDDRMVQISAVSAVPQDQSFAVPTLELPSVTAHTGRLLLKHEDRLRLLATVTGGARRLSVSEDAAAAAQGEVFDFWLQKFDVAVQVRPRDRELFAEINSVLDIQETIASLNCSAAVETLNAPLFELSVVIPLGWQIQHITDDNGRPLTWRTTAAESSDASDAADGAAQGTPIILEPAAAISAGGLLNLNVQLSRTISDPTTPQTLVLPVLSIPEALVVGGTYQISAASDLTVAPQEISGLSPVGIDGDALLFESQSTQWSGQLLVSRKPARLSSRTVLRSWMDARQKSTEAVVTVDVVQGTTRTVQLLIPFSWGTAVRFEVLSVQPVPGISDQVVPASVDVIEQTVQEADNEQLSVQLTFDQRFVGAVTLRTLVQQTRQPDTVLSAPFVKTVGAVRQHGLIVFEAYPEQQLTAAANPLESGLQPADASLVQAPSATSGRRTALVFRFVQPDYQLTLQETRYDTQAVPSAVCEAIHNVSVLGNQGAIQREAKVVVQCVGVQTLRFTLPDAENSFLWSTMLNDAAVEVRRDGSDYLVAVPTGQQQTQHVLDVLFETSRQQTSVLGQTTQNSLQLAIDTDRQRAAAINILEQTWEVRYPSSAMLLNYDGGFQPQTDLQQAGWLQSVRSLLQSPDWNSAGRELLIPAVVLLALFVVTALIVRRRWKSLLGVLVLAGACMLLSVAMLQRDFARTSRSVSSRSAEDASSVQSPRLYEEQADVFFENAGEGMGGGMGMGGMGDVAENGFSGGGSVGGLGGMNTVPMDELRRSSGDALGLDPGMFAPNAAAAPQPPAAFDRKNADADAADANGVTPTDRSGQAIVPNAAVVESVPQKKGDARLSIRAQVVAPEDFRDQQFRSIGDSAQAGVLQVVIQQRSQLNALRIAFAAVVVLVCLWFSGWTWLRKLRLIVILFFGTLAAVALVPNEWQSAVDGVLLGTALSLVLWIVIALVQLCTMCCHAIRRRNCCGWFRSASVTSSLLVIGCFVTAAEPAAAQEIAAQEVAAQEIAAQEIAAQQNSADKLTPEMILPYDPDRPALMAERVFLPREEFLKLYRLANPDQLQSGESVPKGMDSATVVAAFYVSEQLRQVRDTQWSQSIRVRYVIRNFTDTAQTARLPLGNVAVRTATLNGNDAVLLAVTDPDPGIVPYSTADDTTPANNGVPANNLVPSNNAVQQAEPQVRNNVQQQQALQPPSKVAPPLPAADRGAFAVRVPNTGLHLLDVVFEVAATVENSVGQLTLPLKSVPAGTLLFTLPAADLEARVSGRSNTFRKDQATLTIPLTSAGDLRIDWRPKTTSTVADSIYHSTVNSALELSDAGLTLKAALQINVRQGQLAEIDLTLPADYVVQRVQGADVAGWSQPEEGSGQLKIVLRQPVEAQTNIHVTLFKPQTFGTTDTNLEVPVPAVQGASRDSGNIAVLAGPELEVRTAALSGVTQLNAADASLPTDVNAALRPVLAWRYTRHPAAITVRAFRTADRLTVTVLNGVQLDAQRQLWTTQVTAVITGSPQRRLKLKVPRDFLALSVNATDLADWYFTDTVPADAAEDAAADANANPEAAVKAADDRILNVQFSAARVGKLDVVIQGQTGRSADATTARLMAPQVLAADAAETHVSVWLDAASEIASSAAEGWKRSGSERAIDSRILQLRPQAPDISFISSQTVPAAIVLNLRPAPASLVAESVLVTNVTDTSLELTLGLNWKISRAATRELAFTIPASLADALNFRIPGLRLLQREIVDDSVRLTVHLQQPVSDSFFVLGTGTLPLPSSKQIAPLPAEFVVSSSSPASIASQAHFAVMVNQSSGLLQLQNGAGDDENVSPDELTTRIPKGFLQQSVAIRRLKQDQPNPVWNLQFPAPQPVSPAVVSLADHTTIIAEDGTWRSRHRLQVRNESRQFLPVRLPQNAQVLYCLVQSEPTRIVTRIRSGSSDSSDNNPAANEAQPSPVATGSEQVLHLIPVPQSGELSTSFEVEFALSGRLPEIAGELAGRALTIPVPEFPEYRDDPEFGITVSRNTWSVYVPEAWNVSLLNDPRQTSVIPASEAEFQDVALMSAVDDARSMIGSLAAPYLQDSSGGLQWLEIQKQKQMLGAARGNSAAAETERAAALQQLNEAESQLQQQAVELQQITNAAGQPQNARTNRYLERLEQTQNDFNATNSLDLLLNNSIADMAFGRDESEAQLRTETFQFALPQESKPAAEAGKKRGAEAKEKASKSEAAEPQSRSQLLDRRKSIVQQQTDKLQMQKGQQAIQQQQQGRQMQIRSPQSQNVPQAPDIPFASDFGIMAGDEIAQPAAKPAGALSLDFQVPAGGVRHDFIRTGGNPALTFTVRSSDAIQTALQIAWAAGCLLAALLLLNAATRSSSDLLLRVLIVTIIISLAGWLTLPHPLRIAALLLCLATAAATSLLIIIRSFTKSNKAAPPC